MTFFHDTRAVIALQEGSQHYISGKLVVVCSGGSTALLQSKMHGAHFRFKFASSGHHRPHFCFLQCCQPAVTDAPGGTACRLCFSGYRNVQVTLSGAQPPQILSVTALLDLVHLAPRLLELMKPSAKNALGKTDMAFYKRFTSPVKVVSVKGPADHFGASSRHWPRPTMFISQGPYSDDLSLALDVHPTDKVMAKIILSYELGQGSNQARALKRVTIGLIKPVQKSATEDEQIAQQLASQITTRWSRLRHFSLHGLKQYPLFAAIMAQLSQRHWSSLPELALTNCGLTSEGVST